MIHFFPANSISVRRPWQFSLFLLFFSLPGVHKPQRVSHVFLAGIDFPQSLQIDHPCTPGPRLPMFYRLGSAQTNCWFMVGAKSFPRSAFPHSTCTKLFYLSLSYVLIENQVNSNSIFAFNKTLIYEECQRHKRWSTKKMKKEVLKKRVISIFLILMDSH